MTKPHLAQRIEVNRGAHSLKIDGLEFPWLITEEGPRVGPVNSDTIPTVTLTILADHVVVNGEDVSRTTTPSLIK